MRFAAFNQALHGLLARFTIKTKLIAAFILFGAVLVSTLGVIAYYNADQALRKATFANLESRALEKEAALNDWFAHSIEEVASFARLEQIGAYVTQLTSESPQSEVYLTAKSHLTSLLKLWNASNMEVSSAMLLEPKQGRVILATNPAEEGTFKENREYFTRGRKAPVLQSPYYSITMQAPMITIAAPVTTLQGKLKAVLAVRQPLDVVTKIIERRTGRYETDDAFLINSARLLLTQPRYLDDPSVMQRVVYSHGIDHCLAGQSDTHEYVSSEGIPVFAAYRWMQEYQLCLLVKIHQSEALAPSQMIVRLIWIVAFLAMGPTIIGSFALANLLTRPLHALKLGADRVAAGNFDTVIDMQGRDELADLAKAFNFMIATIAEKNTKIRAYAEGLEQRVVERTSELQAAQNELLQKERLAALGQLTATVSHELRNPLGAMRPSLYVIRKRMADNDERVLQAVARIERAILRCDRIIDELLDFTRNHVLQPESVTIDTWLKHIIDEQQFSEEIDLQQEYALPGIKVMIDEERLRRAIINVLENALQAMADNNSQPISSAHLRINTGIRNQRVEMVISDTGPGIAADVLPRIFEPLFSTKGFGTGLGLPTVKRIMELHGGGIEVDTVPKRGTCVTLWLPLAKRQDSAA